jgi:uncharacterized delta-60 repeat protein
MMMLSACFRHFCCAVLALFPVCVPAAPGDLDFHFNPTGNGSPRGTVLDQVPGLSTSLRKLAVQADGRIVGAGYAGSNLVLVRWWPDGSLDPEFSNGGRVVHATSDQPFLTAMSVQGDGKTVVTFISHPLSVLRFLPNGTPDPDYGSGGTSHPSIGGPSGYFTSLLPLDDGKMLAGGTVQVSLSSSPPKLWRLLPDGSVDPAFGSAGGTILPFEGAIEALAMQPDGKIVAAGFDAIGGEA